MMNTLTVRTSIILVKTDWAHFVLFIPFGSFISLSVCVSIIYLRPVCKAAT